jgi:hypothetical protein
MKLKSITLFLLAGTLSLGMTVKSTGSVYICDSPNATRFHLKKECNGLDKCTHEIKSVTAETAKSRGLTLCGWEK